MRHQLVDRQPPGEIQLDVARQIALRHGGAEEAAFERAFLDHQIGCRQIEGMRRMRQTDGHRGAAGPGDLVSGLQCGNRARRLDRDIHAVAGRRLDLRHQVRIIGPERVRGAERAREFQFRIELVDGDDLACARRQRAEQRRQADAAQAHDGGRTAQLHLRAIDGGADAGQHGAAEQCAYVERQLGVDFDERPARQHGVFGEAGNAGLVIEHALVHAVHAAVSAEQRAGGAGDKTRLAQRRPAFPAGQAVAAIGREHQRDVVAAL